MITILKAGQLRRGCVVSLFLLFIIVILPGCSKNRQSVIQDSQVLLSGGKYEEAITMLEKASKTDEIAADSIKPVLTNAHLLYGNYLMYKSTLPQPEKYGKALSEFRKVLALDSTNQEAKKNRDIIEGIYGHEGIPLPKE